MFAAAYIPITRACNYTYIYTHTCLPTFRVMSIIGELYIYFERKIVVLVIIIAREEEGGR